MELNYRILGRSGLRVSELCLGTMTFGSDWGWGADRDESRQIFDAFRRGGRQLRRHGEQLHERNERAARRRVRRRRPRPVRRSPRSTRSRSTRTIPTRGGNHRKSLVRSLEQSLRRLRTDYVDLLWLHMRDATTPIEEAVRALDDQVRRARCSYVGISDSPAWVVAQANAIAELRGWSPFAALQVPYNAASTRRPSGSCCRWPRRSASR